MSNHEAVEWVKKGNRLEKPIEHFCPWTGYKLMLACWNETPKERPAFQTIKETLQKIQVKTILVS